MAAFQNQIIEHLPYLRAFARGLARNAALADDLVQDTFLRAISNSDKFIPGTNLRAWLSTILRNQFFNEMRCRSRQAAYVALPRPVLAYTGDQESRHEMRDLERAFHKLPAAQGEALSLVGASGYSYEEAADIVGCAQGTIKSRVFRARAELEWRLAGKDVPLATPLAA